MLTTRNSIHRRLLASLVPLTLLASFCVHAANPSIIKDPQFEGFRFYAPVAGNNRSNAANCRGGLPGQVSCFKAGGWFPYVQSTAASARGRVELRSSDRHAVLTRPGGGNTITDYVTLGQQVLLRSGSLYRFTALVRTERSSQNRSPYVSTFCGRDETSPGGGSFPANDNRRIFQGEDTLLQPGLNRVSFVIAGDGKPWFCSVALLGQPGSAANKTASIRVERFSIRQVARLANVQNDLPVDTAGSFDNVASDLSGSPWSVIKRGNVSATDARIHYTGNDAALLLDLTSANDNDSITVQRPVTLRRGGLYTLCGSARNLNRSRPALANFLLSRRSGTPGNQGGFVIGPVDVSLSPDETEVFKVDFAAPYSGTYQLTARALGYGNTTGIQIAFDDISVVPRSRSCPV